MYVCVCNAVTERDIAAAVCDGMTTLRQLRRDLGVTADVGLFHHHRAANPRARSNVCATTNHRMRTNHAARFNNRARAHRHRMLNARARRNRPGG